MPRTIHADGRTITVPDDATPEEINQIVGPAPKTASASTPAAQPGFWENLGHTIGIGTQEDQQRQQHPIRSAIESYPPIAAAEGLFNGGKRILGEYGEMGKAAMQGDGAGVASHYISATPLIGPALSKMADESDTTPANASWMDREKAALTPGNFGTALGTAAQVAPMLLGGTDSALPERPGLPPIGPSIRSAAIGDPDVAAIRAAGVPKKAALGFKSDVQGARPYLGGAQSVEDVQQRAGIGGSARDEIYKPISDFLSEHGGRVVDGPDGPTTLQGLENERTQTSAQLRQLKAGGPEGIALATQKGLTQADLLARQSALEEALDPHLMGAGIDSPLIRQTFGQVARVGDQFAGRLTDAEKPTPYGFGRMLNMRIDNPRSWLGSPAQGVRDLVAGRPLWSGNAGDVGVGEAFRNVGPKPDFRAPSTAMPAWENPPRLLESNVPGNAPYGEEPYAGSMNGIPERNPIRVTPAPSGHPLLPASASQGEVQPMIRYATPYAEPYDPGLRPFSPPEYLKPGAPYNAPLVPKPTQGAQ
jgi:hypothetical protein